MVSLSGLDEGGLPEQTGQRVYRITVESWLDEHGERLDVDYDGDPSLVDVLGLLQFAVLDTYRRFPPTPGPMSTDDTPAV